MVLHVDPLLIFEGPLLVLEEQIKVLNRLFYVFETHVHELVAQSGMQLEIFLKLSGEVHLILDVVLVKPRFSPVEGVQHGHFGTVLPESLPASVMRISSLKFAMLLNRCVLSLQAVGKGQLAFCTLVRTIFEGRLPVLIIGSGSKEVDLEIPKVPI